MEKASLSLSVHPIVILNISEFFNRMRVNFGSKRVFGGLVGEQHSNRIELFSIFEFLMTENGELDQNFLDQRRKISEQLYPNYDFLGFFSTNIEETPDDQDKKVYSTLVELGVASPVNIVLCSDLKNKDTLPLKAYSYDKEKDAFQKIDIEISGYESERICLDTITKHGGAQNQNSQLVQNQNTLHDALKMLKNNLQGVRDLIKDPKNRKNPRFVELVDDIMKNYPNLNTQENNNNLQKSFTEMLLLANTTSSSLTINYSKNI